MLVAALAVFVALPSVLSAAGAGTPLGVLGGTLASIAMPTALYWRRTRPVASAVVVYAAALLHFVLSAQLIAADLLIFVALYSVTVYGPVWAGRVALGGALFGSLLQAVPLAGTSGPASREVSASTGSWRPPTPGASPTSPGSSAWSASSAGRSGCSAAVAWHTPRPLPSAPAGWRSSGTSAGADRHCRGTLTYRPRDARRRRPLLVRRHRPGRRWAVRGGRGPDAAVRALTTISETGRAALADMGKILGVLRTPGHEDQPQHTTPQPIDADLDTLVEQLRASGLFVSLVRVGESRPLPPGLGLTVYRICQEG